MYGKQFEPMLQQQGLTLASLKDQLKSNLLIKAAIKENTKISDKDLQNQFKSFQPKVTVNEILVSSKSDAEKVISQLKDGKKFSDLAKKYSKDSSNKNNGGRLDAFDNTDTTLDSNFKEAAFKLSNGEYTKTPVKTQYGYQVIQMVNHPKKGSYKDHINELKDQIVNEKAQDSVTARSVMSKVLKNGGVEIKDKDLQNILSGFLK